MSTPSLVGSELPSELPQFRANQAFLRRLARGLVHDDAHADDLVQETWTSWVERRPEAVGERAGERAGTPRVSA